MPKTFSFFKNDQLSKSLKALLKDDPTNYIDEETYTKLMDSFNHLDAKIPREEVCDKLLRKASKQTSYSGAIRSLMVIHKIIHKLGCQGFDPSFLGNAKGLTKFSTYKATDSSPEAMLHAPHVRYYYTYLQRLSYSYEDFQVCFFPESKLPESIIKEGISFLHFLTRLQNMLIFIMQFLPIFEASFLKFPKLNLIRQLAQFYLTDCFYFYTYLNQALTPMLEDIFSHNKSDAICLYELYNEHIKITEKLKESFQLTRYIEEFDIRVPTYHVVDVKFQKKAEKHIQTLTEVSPTIKLGLLERKKIALKCLTPAESTDESTESEYSSVKKVNKILAFIVHPNDRVDSAEDSPVIKAPNRLRRKSEGPMLRPRIRILKPVDKAPEKEAEMLYEIGNDPNPNLLRVPTGEDAYHTLDESVCQSPTTPTENNRSKFSTQSSTKNILTV